MSVPMELDEPATDAVPLDLTVKKDDNCATPEAKAERDGPGKLTEDAAPAESNAQNGVKSTPLDLSAGRALPLPPPPSVNVAQRASVVVLSPKVPVVKSSPPPSPPKPQPQRKVYWAPDSSSPMMATEHLAPLHGMYADAAAYRHMISSAAVPEYNPFLPVLPTSAATQLHHHNHIQHQQQQLQMQQQHHIHLQQQLQLQLQMQQQHNQEQQQKLHKQTLQLQAAYGGLPLDPALMLSGSPVYTATSSPSSSESNHFPFGGFDCNFSKPAYGFGYPYYDRMLDGRVTSGTYGAADISASRSDCPSPESTTTCTTTTDDHRLFHHHHQQQRDLDREHRHRINSCAMDDMDVVDPEEVAAIYRHSDFLSFRHRYIESLGPPRNFEKMRRSNNNNNNNSSSSSNNNDDDHGLTHGQQQYDQSYVMKRQKNNEAAKRSRDAKRQKYIENQISVMYLTKKVSEMKEIKRRLLKANSNILAE